MFKRLTYLLLIITTATAIAEDKYQWLEAVDGDKALAWVKEQNDLTDKSLGNDTLYKELYQDALAALGKQDKLPSIQVKGNWVYQLHKNKKNPRGVYQRSAIEAFKQGNPDWQTVLDIDKLSHVEETKWVFKGMTCLSPKHDKCLVSLAPGGTDAHVLREFDPNLGTFEEKGFYVPLAKTRASWLDEDHLIIGTDFGKDSLTTSGYPRIQKIWRRDTELSEAETLLEVSKDSVSAGAIHYDGDNYDISVLIDATSFWKRTYYQWLEGDKVKLSLPETARLQGVYNGKLVILLKSDWTYKSGIYKQGSMLLVDPAFLRGGKGEIETLAEQSRNFIIESVSVNDKGIYLVAMEDAKSSLYFYSQDKGVWNKQLVPLPENGQIAISGQNDDVTFVRYENFLTPPTLFAIDSSLKVTKVMQQSATFDSSDMMVKQYFATSKDGTKVPYFAIMNKNTRLDGTNPTHIFSYGGFRSSMQPSYSGSYEDLNGAYGNMWLKRGGIYVLANIRGGGEYGPAWHAAALRENRARAFEDFEAVAEDLIKRKYTSSKHLGMEGRSNGGLLVGAVMTRRPDLFNAVVCGVPLLDMKRYHTLLAGASWMAEYGNPDTADWDFIKEYSPYQNVNSDTKYPATFFFTSTRDDRVHPGHARKMAAKLKSLGQTVEYYENMEGGHKGSSTKEQMAKRIALAFTHLWRQLN